MTIIQLPTEVLTGSCPDFIVGAAANVTFSLYLNDLLIVNEVYVPDAVGNVYVRDLGVLLEQYIPAGSSIAAFQYLFVEGNDTINSQTGTFFAYYCRADVGNSLTGADYIARPLTLLTTRTTSKGRKELVSFMQSNADFSIGYSGSYLDPATNYPAYFDKVTAIGAGTLGKILSLESGPADIEALASLPAGSLIEYSIYAIHDNASVKTYTSAVHFLVEKCAFPTISTFEFINNFNAPERFTCVGVVDRAPVWERTFGTFARNYRGFNVILNDPKTVNSGYLTADEYALMLDMLNALHVWLITDERTEITILSESIDLKGESQEPDSVEFSYRVTNYNQYKHTFAPSTPYDDTARIFNPTFDQSYN